MQKSRVLTGAGGERVYQADGVQELRWEHLEMNGVFKRVEWQRQEVVGGRGWLGRFVVGMLRWGVGLCPVE